MAKGLSRKNKAFIAHYLREWNGAKAARLAGYPETSARQIASRLLSKDYVQAAIKDALNELTMSAEEVIVRLTEHGRSDMGEFIGKSPREIADSPNTRLIKKFEHTITGYGQEREEKIKVELYDAQTALLHLWKHHQLATGKPTEQVDVSDARERLAQLIARQAERGTAGGDSSGTES